MAPKIPIPASGDELAEMYLRPEGFREGVRGPGDQRRVHFQSQYGRTEVMALKDPEFRAQLDEQIQGLASASSWRRNVSEPRERIGARLAEGQARR